MLRAAASIEKQVVYSSRQEIIDSSGSEGLQLPTFVYTCANVYHVCLGAQVGWKRVLGPMELEIQTHVSHIRALNQTLSSESIVHAVNLSASASQSS